MHCHIISHFTFLYVCQISINARFMFDVCSSLIRNHLLRKNCQLLPSSVDPDKGYTCLGRTSDNMLLDLPDIGSVSAHHSKNPIYFWAVEQITGRGDDTCQVGEIQNRYMDDSIRPSSELCFHYGLSMGMVRQSYHFWNWNLLHDQVETDRAFTYARRSTYGTSIDVRFSTIFHGLDHWRHKSLFFSW